ncbi:MAG: ADP compounds hydrolase NudE [Rhodanobacteraceae bacterium]|jgi:ADP-ribose diphosphatase|nr:ADP compounds hydrolase NudE [Rhodanobacteraceae bacterium]MBL8245770.1 ADP compounds hydrolase NudE [Rhodanobacteraceae bacterium]
MKQLPKIHESRLVEPRYKIEQMDLEFANGERRTYERIHGSGRPVVVIVPMLDADTVLLTREYAAGLHRYELGLPRGRVDAGETVLEGAQRELKEETGYGARELFELRSLSLAPTYMSHVAHVLLARDLYEERLPGDEPEEIEVVPWKIDDLSGLLTLDEFSEGRAMAALFLAREWLRRDRGE